MGQYECLAHYGIKGQKWGVRRYQNPDGTLSEEGKRHYGVGNSKMLTPNTKEKIKSYAKSGLKTGLAVSAALGIAAGASFVSDYMTYAPTTFAMAYNSVLGAAACIAGEEAVANAGVLGLTGLGYGAVIGLMAGNAEDEDARRKYGRS